jgi:hypothetical protein
MRWALMAAFDPIADMWIRLSLLVSLLFCAWSVAADERAVQLATRGTQLRQEIDTVYRELDKAGQIKNNGMGRNFITHVVIKYVPVGISFEDAEAILKSAGFTIRPRIPNRMLPKDMQHDKTAIIDPYGYVPFAKQTVSVALRPKAPDDYSVVTDVSSEITRTSP